MADVTLQPIGTRIYVVGNTYATYAIKDALKRAGCHWDGERKAWWIGAAKRPDIEHLVSSTPAPQAEAQGDRKPDEHANVRARVEYKGREYYMLAETRDGAKLLLAARNGQFQFWAAREATQTVKTYGRENYRSGRTEYPMLGGMIARAAEWQQKSPEQRQQAEYDRGWQGNGCSECRRLGDWCKRCAFDEFDN